MLGLRQKLSLGFGGLLLIILIIGIQSILYLSRLGASIDVILRENYRSVIACQQMKEALERIDSGVLFELLGETREGEGLIRKNEMAFEKALQVELNNITVPGEEEKAEHIQKIYAQYKATLQGIENAGDRVALRREAYFARLLPLFGEIKDFADGILQMNQKNMNEANDEARQIAARARSQMYLFLIAGTAIAIGFMLFIGRWILRPIHHLISSADEIKRGNLDLVVKGDSRDEIGRLSEEFNAMAASLREFRRSDQAKFHRIQRATQQAFDRLPDAVAIIDLEGRVEVATQMARDIFGLKPGTLIFDLSLGWLISLYKDALWDSRTVKPGNGQKVVQHFVNGEERYFRPDATPILDSDRQPAGVMLAVHDVTQLRQQDEIKRGVIATVSHQLKTPLTSVRMAIHLLLEEKVGPLTEKQAELLIAAREDSDRLHTILNSLLDISRIESGRVQMELRPVSPRSIVLDGLEPYIRMAQDQGVTLSIELSDNLPEVQADLTRIKHVFGNLLLNALKYTPPGGRITLSTKADKDWVQFSVSDTGRGIPAKYLSRIFEQFFRVPDQGAESGAGLGLAIVKEIVEAHGGTVGVESQEGKGSAFTFTLRRADRAPAEEEHL